VTEPRLSFALRPRIHPVAESTRAAFRPRNRPHRRGPALVENAGENLEPRTAKNLRDVLHDDRVAQVRLVDAVFAQRLAVRNARELRRHRLALAELLEH